jgi:hypothetical protein
LTAPLDAQDSRTSGRAYLLGLPGGDVDSSRDQKWDNYKLKRYEFGTQTRRDLRFAAGAGGQFQEFSHGLRAFGPGSWTGLGPGDVLLTVRGISSQEIYALEVEWP